MRLSCSAHFFSTVQLLINFKADFPILTLVFAEWTTECVPCACVWWEVAGSRVCVCVLEVGEVILRVGVCFFATSFQRACLFCWLLEGHDD